MAEKTMSFYSPCRKGWRDTSQASSRACQLHSSGRSGGKEASCSWIEMVIADLYHREVGIHSESNGLISSRAAGGCSILTSAHQEKIGISIGPLLRCGCLE